MNVTIYSNEKSQETYYSTFATCEKDGEYYFFERNHLGVDEINEELLNEDINIYKEIYDSIQKD